MLTYIYDSFSNWDYTHIASALTCSYFLYYFYKVVHRPELVAAEGPYKNILRENLHVLKENFWPTFWAFTKHHQTICRVIFKSKPILPYVRETVLTKDQGQISLDWVSNDDNNTLYADAETRPTVIVLPGITGCSDASYVRHIVKEAQHLGYRSLVFNNRGLGKTELKTPRTFCACNAEDLELVLDHVTHKLPKSPIYIFAVSLGGNMQVFEEPATLPYDINDVMKASSIREFDEAFTCKTFGFPSHKEYYTESSLVLKPLEKIQIPMLFLNARDDPFAPAESIPLESIKKNPNMAIVLTDYGGHIGFVEGPFVRGRSLVERLFNQYFSSISKMDQKAK